MCTVLLCRWTSRTRCPKNGNSVHTRSPEHLNIWTNQLSDRLAISYQHTLHGKLQGWMVQLYIPRSAPPKSMTWWIELSHQNLLINQLSYQPMLTNQRICQPMLIIICMHQRMMMCLSIYQLMLINMLTYQLTLIMHCTHDIWLIQCMHVSAYAN
jgi:hypothetical protein